MNTHENFFVTFAFLVMGMALRRIPDVPETTGNVLNLFVIYFSLPALVLLKIHALTVSGTLWVPMAMPWVMLLVTAGGTWVLSRAFSWDRATTGCMLLLVPLGNTSFLGIPMVRAFFGDAATPYAVLYDQVGSFLALSTYGSLILAFFGQRDRGPRFAEIAKKVVTFPPFLALNAALVLRTVSYPPAVVNFLDRLAATLVPLVMIAVGFQLTLRLEKRVVVQTAVGLGIKLAAAPLAALFLCRLAGLTGEAVRVSVFEAGMPPMVSAGALAILANLAPRLAAALVGIGVVASFVTLPLLFRLL